MALDEGRGALWFQVLGPLEVLAGGQAVMLSAGRARAVLAMLVLHVNQVVSVDRLIEAAWGSADPATARTQLHGFVSSLRRALAPHLSGEPTARSRLVTRPPGYVLRVADNESDLGTFHRQVATARQASASGDNAAAVDSYSRALTLWRGRPFDGILSPVLEGEAYLLDQLRLNVIEECARIELELGRGAELSVRLARTVQEYPLHEGLQEILISALYRTGRRADALTAYHSLRRTLADELSVEPGLRLQELYQQLLQEGPEMPPREPQVLLATGKPAQLPADVIDFTGRQHQSDSLASLLTCSPTPGRPGAVLISAITGPGGIGKTSLAVHNAHKLATHFPDGQIYVDLHGSEDAAKDPAEVLAEFLRDLGVPDTTIPAGVDARAARYRTILTGRKVLVVLDNARDSAQVKPLLPGSDGCRVLITSRNKMSGLACSRLDLDVLLPHESHALFASIVGDRVEAEPEATAAVLAHCGGLPLAIRIAGARLAGRPAWSVQALARRLDDQRRMLDELRTDDLAVRATLEVSYDGLRRSARGTGPVRAFQFLGLFPGPAVPLPAMSALLGEATAQAEHALEHLVDCSLLESRAPGRYQIHDLLHAYATERAERDLSPSDRHDGVSRLVRWYLSAIVIADKMLWPHLQRPVAPPPDPRHPAPQFRDLGQALQWLDQERPSLAGIAALAESHGLDAFASLIAVFTSGYYLRCCRWSDWLMTNEIGLRSARRLNDQAFEARLLTSRGIVLGRMHVLDEAEESFTAALKIWENLGDMAGCATTNVNLGNLLEQQGKYREAVTFLTKALALARSSGALSTEGTALGNLGTCQDRLGNYAQALSYQHACLAIWREIGNQDGECTAFMNIGEVYLHSHRPAEALVHLRQALQVAESTHGRYDEAMVLTNLGQAVIALGKTSEAHHYLHKALSIWQALNDPQAHAVSALIAGLTDHLS